MKRAKKKPIRHLKPSVETKDEWTPSRIFNQMTPLGKVSNHIPCLIRYIHTRREVMIVTCTGKEFKTYAGAKLSLLSSGGGNFEFVTCMASDTYHVYVADGNKITAWRRGNEFQQSYKIDSMTHNVIQLLPYAPSLLALYDDGTIVRWDVVTAEHEVLSPYTLEGKANTMIHPPTYINKILIGSDTGSMILLNTLSGQVIYKYKTLKAKILHMVASPAVDVVAIALLDNRVILHNLKNDKTLMKFDTLAVPMSIAFRNEGTAPPMIIAGDQEGRITAWDLETKLLVCRVDAHRKAVTGLVQFPAEPYFVSSSPDNSVAVWVFDMPNGGFRLYNKREGHFKPSNRVRFFGGGSSKLILSSGMDGTLLQFHIYNETYNRSISAKRAMTDIFPTRSDQYPGIIDFTAESSVGATHFEDIVARHAGQVGLSTWSQANAKQGSKVLKHPKYRDQPDIKIQCTCLAMTSCGQFVISGYDDGTAERFNVQSGMHRKTYSLADGTTAHSGTVRGVACDQIKFFVLTGGSDELIRFWDFNTGKLDSELRVDAGISFVIHKNTNFVGVALDNFDIYVIDFQGRKIFRKFVVLSSPLLDAAFSPDNMWLTASAADSCVRTWDLTTGALVDVFHHESLITSLDYSPSGEYLIGSQHDDVGILLWKNKALYGSVSLMPLPVDYEPLQSSASKNCLVKGSRTFLSSEQIENNLITLSLLPASRWKNLLNLDAIKKRNKPIQPAKTYVAPFFLTDKTLNQTDEPMDVENTGKALIRMNIGKDAGEPREKIPRLSDSKLQNALLNMETKPTDSDLSAVMKVLQSMGPSGVSMEIENLGPESGGSVELLQLFIRFSIGIVESKRDFEVGQAYLALFLKTHGVTIYEDMDLLQELKLLKPILPANSFSKLLNSVGGYVKFIKSKLF